jgi:hypothetical protein
MPTLSKALEPGLLGGVLPIGHNTLSMLTNYVTLPHQWESVVHHNMMRGSMATLGQGTNPLPRE